MDTIIIICQLIIALSILNVWLLRYQKSSQWRAGNAGNMKEEFQHYELPEWVMKATGLAKVTLAILLIAGIWYQSVAAVSAGILAIFMLAAILMHIKVKDPLVKSLPAFSLFVLCSFVLLAYTV